VLVDPFDAEAIASGLARVLDDNALRQELIERGRRRARMFRWRSCAEQTLAFLRSIGDNVQRERSRVSERGRQ
jgi:glycosyltransferase involved in cell wall biosynthesis